MCVCVGSSALGTLSCMDHTLEGALTASPHAPSVDASATAGTQQAPLSLTALYQQPSTEIPGSSQSGSIPDAPPFVFLWTGFCPPSQIDMLES